jgi:alpha-1,3-rhamnosyltransferase|tara:strand:- start:400 stop:1326 length:927 start_codon:yes stop_codon:yes gene_type:complete
MQNNIKPLVTVIVPAYNHQDFIEQTIESIVNQTYGYANIELIVIDDCSKDNTGNILRELSKKYEFVFLKNEVNLGVVKNMNSLLKISKGKYISFCASDDYYDINKIEEQVRILESLSDEFAICHADAFIIDTNNKFLFFQNNGNDFKGNIMPKILIHNAIVAPSVLIRKKTFSDVGYFDENISFEDREMWIRIGLKYKFVHIDKALVYRRQHANNLSRDMTKWYQSYSAIFKKYYTYYKKNNLIEEYHYIMFTHLSASNFQLSLSHLLKSKSLFFRKESIYAIFKLFIPSTFFKSSISLKIKSYIKTW